MKNYAVINIETGLVENTVVLDGVSEWTPPDGTIVVQSDIASIGWSYADGVFSPPPDIPRTAEEILERNRYQQLMLIEQASRAMTPVLLSLQLGDATEDETLVAKAWQTYYRNLNLVDVTVNNPSWPQAPY